MCGRYVFFTPDEYEEYREILRRIAKSLKAGIGILDKPENPHPGGEIFPGTFAPVIPSVDFAENNLDKTDLPVQRMYWGFPLDPKASKRVINARSETVESKYMFRKCLDKKRLIVPAKGFYEWKTEENKKKTKTLIRVSGQEAIYMAGLYDEFELPGHGKILCFTILTVDASPQVASIHNRMPALLEERHLELWLNDRIFARYRSMLNKILVPYQGNLEILPTG